ncbi:hypothetical protein HBB16_05915 [Pseudonocardia sp. MCCB 268]|nr:hypothetical protein [Pseudonocardia cytotoxica]
MSKHAADEAPTWGWCSGATLAWLWVGVPFAYGLYQLVLKIPALFG